VSPSTDARAERLRRAIRDVPDFPKAGILFRDITPILGDPSLFRDATSALAEPFVGRGITHVAAIESRGFILGAPVAQSLGAGFVPVRKAGKLPAATVREEYALEYGTDCLEVHADAFPADARVLILDDVLATGGTAAATLRLLGKLGVEVACGTFLVELGFLNGAAKLAGVPVTSIIRY
jgi:adenine phosphoribosyltransferase